MPLLPGDELDNAEIKKEHLDPYQSVIKQIFDRLDDIEIQLAKLEGQYASEHGKVSL